MKTDNTFKSNSNRIKQDKEKTRNKIPKTVKLLFYQFN